MTRSQRFFLVIAATWLGAGLLQAAAGPTASSYLRFLEVERNGSGSITGLDGASGVAVSPDGRTVYATGEHDDALAVCHRDSATGALTFVEMKQDAVDGVDGLNGAHGVVVSPDGVHVYVASKTGDALAVFSRDVDTGALTFVQAKNDGVGKVNGLDGAEGIAISPDGAHVYVAGRNDDSLAVFSRDAATGALTYVEIQRDGYAGVVQGLLGAKAVAVSPDGAHVYAAGSLENAVAVFGRDAATGKLTFIEVQREGQNGVLGLFGAKAVTVSLDGANLYVAGGYDDALVVFDRNPETGMLTSVQLLEDGVGGVNGLNGADAVAVSPDGTHVFVTGSVDNALAVFERDPATGTLTYVERLRDGIAGVDGLHKAQAVAVSPDGASVYAAGSADTAVAVFRVRRCGDGVLDPGEQCDDGNVQDGDCCSSTCRFEPATTLCRPAAGGCDVAEFCTGASGSCPADLLEPSTFECRGAMGSCDEAELCTGTDSACPADAFKPAAVECRPAAGDCDVAETCTGTGPTCPADGKTTAVCRPAAGACDVEEHCDGVSDACPADGFEPAGTACSAEADACAPARSCTGATAQCRTAEPKVGFAAVLCAFDRHLDQGACRSQTMPPDTGRLFMRAGTLVTQARGAPPARKRRLLQQAAGLLKRAGRSIARAGRRKHAPLAADCANAAEAMISDALGRVLAAPR